MYWWYGLGWQWPHCQGTGAAVVLRQTTIYPDVTEHCPCIGPPLVPMFHYWYSILTHWSPMCKTINIYHIVVARYCEPDHLECFWESNLYLLRCNGGSAWDGGGGTTNVLELLTSCTEPPMYPDIHWGPYQHRAGVGTVVLTRARC